MDQSLFSMDDQTQSTPPTLTDTQPGDLDSPSLLNGAAENCLSACEMGAERMSELSDSADKSTASISLCEQKNIDSACLSSNFNISECLPLCSVPRDWDESRVCCYTGSSEPVLPNLSPFSLDYIPPESESEFHMKEPTLSFSSSGPRPFEAVSSTLEALIEPSVTEPLYSHGFSPDHSQAAPLLRSLSHQSDSLESDTDIAPVSDLYIFESETQDFILSPVVDPEEIQCPEYCPLSQTEGAQSDPDCNPHVLVCYSENVMTQRRHDFSEEGALSDCESDVGQDRRLIPAAVGDVGDAGPMLVNDAQHGKAEVIDITTQLQRSDSPTELWLDACQYLVGEDTEDRGVSDKTAHSVMQGGLTATSDHTFPARETQVSGYKADASEGIGCSDDDTISRGPPVERWSSVDSWASALSDWTGFISAPPEDLTAAFTEIGAEIDALRQALEDVNTHLDIETSKHGGDQELAVQAHTQLPMGVQDQPLKTQNIPESSVLSGQSCISLCLGAAGHELEDREGIQSVECLCDTTSTAQEENHPDEIQSESGHSLQHISVGTSGATVASPGGYGVDVMDGSTSSAALDFSHFGGYVESFATDIFINNDEVILNIIEDTDLEGQEMSAELIHEGPFADQQCEVTDDCRFSHLGSVVEQEAQRSSGPFEVDHEGTESTKDPHFFTTHPLTVSHLPGVNTRPGLHINAHAHKSSDITPDFDGPCQLEPQWGSPKFIMPLAPVGIGSSLVCQTNSSSLRGEQTCAKRSLNDNRDLSCDHVQPCIPWPTSGGITVKPSVEGDKELIQKNENTTDSPEKLSPEEQLDLNTTECLFPAGKTITEEFNDHSRQLSDLGFVLADHFFVSEKNRVAVITLDLNDPFVSWAPTPHVKPETLKEGEKMPHKTHKSTSESKTRSKKSAGHHYGAQPCKKQENVPHHVSAQQVGKQQETQPVTGENLTSENIAAVIEDKEVQLESGVAAEKAPNKQHGKKKKKHGQHATEVKSVGETPAEVENGAKPKTAKGRIDMFEAKLGSKAGKTQTDSDQSHGAESKQQEAKASPAEKPPHHADHKDHQPKNFTGSLSDDVKRRRLSENKFGRMVSALESKLLKTDVSVKAKGEEPKVDAAATPKKAYSEVVKQKITPKEEPKVVKSIQAEAVSGDPQSLCLWCQFAAVFSHHTVTWSRDATVLAEIKRSAGDESRVSLTISNASHKDLGKYQCRLTSLNGSVTLDYLLTYEVLSEIVIPPSPKTIPSAPAVEGGTEEEDVKCSRLLFKEDFLSGQYFGENQPVSIITEKEHFGEGMHRRAFRTKLHVGQIPLLLPGHPCVLKVHNSISYGTKNNEELVQKNFTLAVEECQVQNTAREYIKAYTDAAQSVEAFGQIPEIIPIYLVHRPSNNIPYATLEEELIGDFVKYSVKDGKEINLMRRDSEAGQKCCAFQHWVYHKTEGNLLVTDMQGVGMRLTDVGIATSKKGYKGFKGNCATSFIDQFKALHQCNKYCEILGLKSLQPKAKKPPSALKPKPQPAAAPKKKTFGPTVKGKS